jgi:hypothetical protein
MLIAQVPTQEEQRLVSQPAAPPIPTMPVDRGWTDMGMTIVVCGWIARQAWAMFSQQQSAEAKMTQSLIAAVLEQNKILLTAIVERKTGS